MQIVSSYGDNLHEILSLFSEKIKNYISKCLLKFLPSMLNFKYILAVFRCVMALVQKVQLSYIFLPKQHSDQQTKEVLTARKEKLVLKQMAQSTH